MNYLAVFKTDKKRKLKKKLSLEDGFEFKKKVHITLYEPNIIHYILIKKLNSSLKALINLYLLYEDDEDSCASTLVPRIEVLRGLLIHEYALFLEETEIESYLDKLNKLERKSIGKISKKNRRR